MILKNHNKVPNTHFVIYCNERTIPLAGICLKYFDKYVGLDSINISVALNRFNDVSNLPYCDKVNYLSPQIPFDPGGHHFAPVMVHAIDSITEDFIFYFCEDYMLTSDLDFESLNKLINIFTNEKVDNYTFSSFQPENHNKTQQPPNFFKLFPFSEKYGFKSDELYYVGDGHMHQFSVQPCIWRKSSYKELFKYNPDCRLHHLDSSHIKGKNGTYRDHHVGSLDYYLPWSSNEDYMFRTLCSKYMTFDYYPYANQKFIITYVEMVGHGKFTLPGRPGNNLAPDNWVQQKIFEIVNECDLRNKPEFDIYFYDKQQKNYY